MAAVAAHPLSTLQAVPEVAVAVMMVEGAGEQVAAEVEALLGEGPRAVNKRERPGVLSSRLAASQRSSPPLSRSRVALHGERQNLRRAGTQCHGMSAMPPAFNWIVEFWWLRLPRIAGRVWRPLAALMADGISLTAWPPVAALAPLFALAIGFFMAWPYLKSGDTFASSMLVMGLMLAVAYVAIALSVWVWLGYVVADTFLVAHPLPHYAWFERLMRVRGSLLVSYLLLAALLIGLPLAAQALSALVVSGLRPGGRPRKIIVIILQPLLQGAMVYSWAQAAPILIAPVFTWRNLTVPAAITAPLHDRGWVLAILAVIICAGRSFTASWAGAQPEVKERIAGLKQTLAALPRRPSQRPTWAAAITRAGLITLTLSGLFAGWLDAVICCVFLTLLGIAQSDWINQLRSWTRMVSYIPVIVRLLLGLAIGTVLGRLILVHSQPQVSYRPLLFCLAVTMTAVALLLPKPAGRSQTQGMRLGLGGANKLKSSAVGS